MKRRSPRNPSTKAWAISSAVVLLGSFAHADELEHLPAEAGDFSLKIEPGLALALSKPQSQLFDVGGGETLKALWTLTPFLDVGPSATFIALPSDTAQSDTGTAWTLGGGLRLKRPHHAPGSALEAISPWLDVDALYVRTGDLNRPGFAVGAGLAVPLGEARVFWFGPFVRYLQIMQGVRTGFDNQDARILSLGVSLEVGAGVKHRHEAVAVAQPVAVETRIVDKEVVACPDRDKDFIPDNVDHCPDVAGPMDYFGCPAYKNLVVKRDKLELKERLYFAWDQATLQDVSFPVLDEVAQALNDNKNFRVQVEGHTSSEGGDDHNQTLSEQRATAVLDYLVAHGVSKERLVSKGFSSSVPVDSNETSQGRENNRRVEFVVNFIILNEGTK